MAMTPTIPTAGGRTIDLANPDPMAIHIGDIATHLSRINRFTGAVAYTVAQHSVLVSRLCPPLDRLPLCGLLHDAHEAYMGDISSPLKLLLPDLAAVEDRLERAVAFAFGLPLGFQAARPVKVADLILLATERRDLVPPNHCQWVDLPAPLDEVIEPWPPQAAAELFLIRYRELTGLARY